jgi:hypothetical protein
MKIESILSKKAPKIRLSGFHLVQIPIYFVQFSITITETMAFTALFQSYVINVLIKKIGALQTHSI